ncbi:MAG: DNA repair protein RecO [Christensenellales bacterium]|jgi:DNA repair protein RecO (recombination protein O)
MPQIQTPGIVLRQAAYGEVDRMLTLLTPAQGALTVSAKGCRRPKSKLLAATQPFCWGEYALYQKGERYGLTQCVVRESFFGLHGDLERLNHGSLMLNLAEYAAHPDQNSRELFALLLRGLGALCYGQGEPEGVTGVFLLRLWRILGVQPELGGCVFCGRPDAGYFSVQAGGRVCADCRARAGDGRPLPGDLLEVLTDILRADLTQPASWRLDQPMARRLFTMMTAYLDAQMGRSFKSLEMILRQQTLNSPEF